MDIGKYLVKARKNKGLSQEDVANSLNVSRQSVSLWECDQTIPTLDNLLCLSNLYDVSIAVLTGQEEFENKNVINNEEERLKIEAEREEMELAASSRRFFIIAVIFLAVDTVLVLVPILSLLLIIPSIVFSIISIKRKRTNYNLFTLIFSICIFLMSIYAIVAMNSTQIIVENIFNIFK